MMGREMRWDFGENGGSAEVFVEIGSHGYSASHDDDQCVKRVSFLEFGRLTASSGFLSDGFKKDR